MPVKRGRIKGYMTKTNFSLGSQILTCLLCIFAHMLYIYFFSVIQGQYFKKLASIKNRRHVLLLL